jgi:hypothetical protein
MFVAVLSYMYGVSDHLNFVWIRSPGLALQKYRLSQYARKELVSREVIGDETRFENERQSRLWKVHLPQQKCGRHITDLLSALSNSHFVLLYRLSAFTFTTVTRFSCESCPLVFSFSRSLRVCSPCNTPKPSGLEASPPSPSYFCRPSQKLRMEMQHQLLQSQALLMDLRRRQSASH